MVASESYRRLIFGPSLSEAKDPSCLSNAAITQDDAHHRTRSPAAFGFALIQQARKM
jgi:hypothetical protein